uniref:NADH-ubiquinone oxidoreductase chain 6 n=1 Tax=Curculionidae sp. 6 AH-2016 TaxID=1903832 RepID=A0A343C2S9_9CUCU|nr:NADH dehydrogenase subunit 6 [Curculionidae sp. 6 AH-2016]
MLMYLSILNWTFSMIFIYMNHPLSLGCMLLIQTILISLSTGLIYSNFWFSYILFLIMIGGMLIMFIYMTSIASNEKFKLPKLMNIFSLTMIIFIILTMILMDNFYSELNMNKFVIFNLNLYNNLNLNKYFNYPNMLMMLFLMIYLLMTLIATVKIVDKNYGTLRQK